MAEFCIFSYISLGVVLLLSSNLKLLHVLGM